MQLLRALWGRVLCLARQTQADLSAVWMQESPPRWRLLPWVLAAAWLLRLLAGLSGDYFLRADEISQYLEQAHRLVFGYGYVPWEYDVGARTWLIAAVPAAILLLSDALGLGHPDFYIPAVKVFNATLAMAIPVGGYVLCRRLVSEPVARAACVVLCFWYEFIVFAAHTLSECYAAAAFFAAAALLKNPLGMGRAVAAGLLLGLTISLRVPYAPTVAGFGLVLLLLPLRQAERAGLLAGGAAALLAWGALDWATWGGPWASILTYVQESRRMIPAYDQFVPQVLADRVVSVFWPNLGLMYAGRAMGGLAMAQVAAAGSSVGSVFGNTFSVVGKH